MNIVEITRIRCCIPWKTFKYSHTLQFKEKTEKETPHSSFAFNRCLIDQSNWHFSQSCQWLIYQNSTICESVDMRVIWKWTNWFKIQIVISQQWWLQSIPLRSPLVGSRRVLRYEIFQPKWISFVKSHNGFSASNICHARNSARPKSGANLFRDISVDLPVSRNSSEEKD
jgi:hypothetical protein